MTRILNVAVRTAKFPLRFAPQPLTSIAVVATALAAVVVTGGLSVEQWGAHGEHALLLLILGIAVVLSEQFPIHVRHNTKVQMTTVPLFLMAVLLAPPYAAVCAGLALLVGELTVRKQKGNYLSDIATDAGRWMLAVLVGAEVIQTTIGHTDPAVAYAAGAMAMWICDMTTCPATLSPMSGESPLAVISATVKEAGGAEGANYVIGVLATIVAQEQIWAIALLVLPAACVHVATRRAKELHDGTRQMLESIADTVDLRDPYTGGHSRRVTSYVEGILHQLDYSGPEVPLIVTAARLHDIGKIAVPDTILNKSGKLTPEEWW